uniref:Uncharacterized protein n=1 Tax=Myoviridae sp. ctPVE25 TaxID=2826649 RepID=A0A8S5R0M7_9CAUD|nr:MAG TPA: hypothetical protein [Myoviridae sp. ctPVE25]
MVPITFQISRKTVGFSVRAPARIGITFGVSVRNGGELYNGPYIVDPHFTAQVLSTKEKVLREDITVNPIDVARVSNPSGGNTIYIGGITNG